MGHFDWVTQFSKIYRLTYRYIHLNVALITLNYFKYIYLLITKGVKLLVWKKNLTMGTKYAFIVLTVKKKHKRGLTVFKIK